MRRLRPGDLGLRARAGIAAALLAALAAGTAVAGLGGDGRPSAAGPPPHAGGVVRDLDGEPVLDPSSRPPRELPGSDVIADSTARVLRDTGNRAIRLPSTRSARLDSVERTTRRVRRGSERDQRRRTGPGRRPGQPGVPEGEPVIVGIAYQKPDATVAGIRYSRGALPDGAAIGRATVDHVNATGGVGGRPMKLRAYMFDATTGRDYGAIATEVCEFFGSPPKPVMVTSNGAGYQCFEARGIAFVGSSPWADATRILSSLPHVIVPGGVAYDRWPEPFVQELEREQFFGAGARVGLGYPRGWKGADDALVEMRRALRSAGANVVAEAGIELPRNSSDIAPAIRDIGHATVRFRAAGVNRVLALDIGAGMGLFMQFAEAQGYRPRYGINTTNGPTSLIANAPRAQMKGAIGIGWAPLIDVDAAHDPGAPDTRDECIGIFRAAGIPVGGRSLYGAFAALSLCDSILMARAAMARSGRISPDGLRDGMEGIARQSGLPLASRIDASHHDGAAAYRALAYAQECGCFAYRGGNRYFR